MCNESHLLEYSPNISACNYLDGHLRHIHTWICQAPKNIFRCLSPCLCRWAFSFDTCIMHMHRFVQLLLVLTLRLLTSVPIYFNYDISGTYRLKTDKWFAGLNQNDCTCNLFAFDFIFVLHFCKLILMLFVSITSEFVWCSFISYAKNKELWMFNHSWSQSAHQNFQLPWKGGIEDVSRQM